MEDPYLFWSMGSCQFKDSATGEFSICPFQSWSMGGCQFKERESIQSPPLEGVPSVHFIAWSMGSCQFKDSATGGTSICPFQRESWAFLVTPLPTKNRGCVINLRSNSDRELIRNSYSLPPKFERLRKRNLENRSSGVRTLDLWVDRLTP